jgi:hypothetical protein
MARPLVLRIEPMASNLPALNRWRMRRKKSWRFCNVSLMKRIKARQVAEWWRPVMCGRCVESGNRRKLGSPSV